MSIPLQLFGFCITHILNTGVLKFEKKIRKQKVNVFQKRSCHIHFCLIILFLILFFLEIHVERRQKSISVELSFAMVFAFKHPVYTKLAGNFLKLVPTV